MSYRIEVRALAAREIIEAYDWYEAQKEGLGNELLSELEVFYESLLRNPHAFGYYKQPVRQGKIARFPYVVVFEVFDAVIVVYSFFMTGQSPDKKELVS